MNITAIDPALELESLIELLTSDLKKYEKSDKVNRYYVERQIKLIEKLNSISCTLIFYRNHGLLTTIQKEINMINQVDSEVENFIIKVYKNQESLKTAMIKINY